MSSNVFPILSSSPPPMDGPVGVEPYPMLSSSPPPMDMPEVASNEDDFGGFQECPSYSFGKFKLCSYVTGFNMRRKNNATLI